MRIARWVPTATNTHSEYVILIAFPLRQWLHERAWMLPSTYSAYLIIISYVNFRLQKGSNACSRTVSPEIRLDEIMCSCLVCIAYEMSSGSAATWFWSLRCCGLVPVMTHTKVMCRISLRPLVQLATIIKTSTVISFPDVKTIWDLK